MPTSTYGLGLEDLGGDDLAVLDLVDVRNASRKLLLDDLLAREVLELLDHGAERVTVGGDDDRLASLDEGQDVLVVVRQDTLARELERLALGGRHVVGAAPDKDLLVTPLLAGVVLVEAGERTVVTFVQREVTGDGDLAGQAELLELDVERVLGTLEVRGEGLVEVSVAGLLEELAAESSFLAALGCEVGVLPPGEEIELVPLGFAVTRKDESAACERGKSMGWSADHERLRRTSCSSGSISSSEEQRSARHIPDNHG